MTSDRPGCPRSHDWNMTMFLPPQGFLYELDKASSFFSSQPLADSIDWLVGWLMDELTCLFLWQQVKVTERYIRRLEFHLSKVAAQSPRLCIWWFRGVQVDLLLTPVSSRSGHFSDLQGHRELSNTATSNYEKVPATTCLCILPTWDRIPSFSKCIRVWDVFLALLEDDVVLKQNIVKSQHHLLQVPSRREEITYITHLQDQDNYVASALHPGWGAVWSVLPAKETQRWSQQDGEGLHHLARE